MDVTNDSYNFAREAPGLIIKAPSKEIFGFTELTLSYFADMGDLNPDAHFLFANLKKLRLDLPAECTAPITKIDRMINQFEQINSNNKIEWIDVSFVKDEDEKLHLLAKHSIQILRLSNSKLCMDDLMCGLYKLTELQFVKCTFDHIDHTAFDFCAQSLLKLEIINTSFNSIQTKSPFKSLVNLKELILTSCKLDQVDFNADFLFGLDKLTKLDLSRSEFKSIKREAFEKLVNLENLNLSELKVLDPENSELFSLKNDVLTLCKDSFSSMTNLRELKLEYSVFAEIEPDAFTGLSSLVQLDLTGAYLRRLLSGTFRGLHNLQDLNLAGNKHVIEIDPLIFIHTPNLERISFTSTNSMKKIDASLFSGLTRLKHLDLSICGLESIEPTAFDDLINIQNLSLKNNKLVEFETKCTPKEINLSFNDQLRSIKFIGSDLYRIEEINLDYNHDLLVEFDSRFSGLKRLHLSFETLSSSCKLTGLKFVEELTLRERKYSNNNQHEKSKHIIYDYT
jgi:Leucine-rich repeat (LRR) protein